MSKKSVSLRKLVVLFSAVCLVCVMAAFTGCGEDPAGHENEEGEESSLSTTNDRLDSMEKQLSYRTDSMEQTTIETAYENGLLTQTDLAYAMYYASGKVFTCKKSDWENKNEEAFKEIDFTPGEQCPEIDEQVELDIKRHIYESNRSNAILPDVTFEEFAGNYSFRFVGSYSGTFVITDEDTIYWDYATDVPYPQWIAGFVWFGVYANDLFVFRYE